MSDSFYQQYQDPRWQRKKYEIMAQRNWVCEWCGAKDRQLHVHHGYYEKDRAVWDYPNDSLYCLCDPCHRKANANKRDAQRALARIHPKHLSECMRRIDAFKQTLDDSDTGHFQVASLFRQEDHQ
jgi:hypothetical protein